MRRIAWFVVALTLPIGLWPTASTARASLDRATVHRAIAVEPPTTAQCSRE